MNLLLIVYRCLFIHVLGKKFCDTLLPTPTIMSFKVKFMFNFHCQHAFFSGEVEIWRKQSHLKDMELAKMQDEFAVSQRSLRAMEGMIVIIIIHVVV